MARRVALAALVLALPAAAELVEVDFAVIGDALVTRDTATGLDWLDPAAHAQAGPEWAQATAAQICELLEGNVGFLLSCPIGGGLTFLNAAPMDAFLDVFGTPVVDVGMGGIARTIGARFDGGGAVPGEVQFGVLQDLSGTPLNGTLDLQLEGTSPFYDGLLLVRSSPTAVPATSVVHGALVGLVLLLAGFSARCRRGSEGRESGFAPRRGSPREAGRGILLRHGASSRR